MLQLDSNAVPSCGHNRQRYDSVKRICLASAVAGAKTALARETLHTICANDSDVTRY